jgi:transposase
VQPRPEASDNESRRFAEVLHLAFIDGLGVRAIAKRLSMSRKTVRRMLDRERRRDRPPPAPRPKLLDSYDAAIRTMLSQTPELKAPAVLERLRPLGYRGGVTIVRARLRALRPHAQREPFLTLHFAPGAALQVDWADFGFALPGCPRRVSAFVAALCYSRYLYLEFTLSQGMGAFLRCMERALRFFGGSTAIDIFDNMKTVVLVHTATTTVFNPRFLEYARTRCFGVAACNPGRGHEKGRVERPIGFVRERFWPGRRFADPLDLNAQAANWRDEFANRRVHEVTGKVPALVFDNEERRLLRPLPETPFNTDDVLSCGVTKTFRVRFDRNLYSVPPRLVGQTVLVRAHDEAVAIFLGPKQVAVHHRCWDVGQDIEHPSHRQAAMEHKPRASAGMLPPGLVGLGDVGLRYLRVLGASCRSLHREIVRLVFLVELFGEAATSAALDEVMRTGHVGAEYVEYVLRHKRGLVPAAAPLRLGDPVLDAISFGEPDLGRYDALTRSPLTRDPGNPLEDHGPQGATS